MSGFCLNVACVERGANATATYGAGAAGAGGLFGSNKQGTSTKPMKSMDIYKYIYISICVYLSI